MNWFDEFFEEENLVNQTYYHGTSTVFNIDKIEPPAETEIIREDFRKNNRDVVYVTTSYGSAKKYAQKAVQKFGGEPVVYEVEPDYDNLVRRMDYEYITTSAKIVQKI